MGSIGDGGLCCILPVLHHSLSLAVLPAGWLFQACGCTAAGDPGGDTRSWSVQIIWGAAGLGFGAHSLGPVLSFGCFGGWSQDSLPVSKIKGSVLAGCCHWCLWTEPQLWLCSVFCGLLGTGEPGQQVLLLPARATSSTQPVQAAIASLAQLTFAALWPISSCKTPA